MGLEKLKFDSTMSMLQNNWLKVRMRLSSHGCTQEVAKHERTVRVARDDGLASSVLSNFLGASITRPRTNC